MSFWNYCKVWYWCVVLISDVKFTALIWWDVKYPRRAPFIELHYMTNVVSPWNAVQELAVPALQSHLVKLVVLLYIKMHETKWGKISMIPFYLDLNIYFLHLSCLLFYLTFESDVQKFSNYFCKCCCVVAWQCSLVAWGGPLPLVDILLNSEGTFACPAGQKSPPFFSNCLSSSWSLFH